MILGIMGAMPDEKAGLVWPAFSCFLNLYIAIKIDI